MPKRNLVLWREALVELSPDTLRDVVAGADTTTAVDKIWDKFSLPTCEGCTPAYGR